MVFGDLIRAIKADLKHDNSIVCDYDWERVRSFNDIEGFDELIELIESLYYNERFLSLGEFPVEYDENTFIWDLKKTPFYQGATDGLGHTAYIPFSATITHKIIDVNSLVAMFSIIQMSFNYDNQHFLTFEEDKAITLSFAIEYLTFFVEDFDNPNNKLEQRSEKEYKNFFKRLHNLYWENDRTKDFEYAVFCVIVDSKTKDYDFGRFIATLGHAVNYLIGCSALKRGRDFITCEDVITGYFTIFKIVLNDMRPLVYSLYDEDKWADESSWK